MRKVNLITWDLVKHLEWLQPHIKEKNVKVNYISKEYNWHNTLQSQIDAEGKVKLTTIRIR